MKFPLYRLPVPTDAIDQGDIIDGCPILWLASSDAENVENPEVDAPLARVLVMTQTCDLANQKATYAVCAVIHDAQYLVDQQTLKTEQIRGQVRAERVFGWYYLPASAALDLPEMIVDFRQLHTVRMDLLTACASAVGGVPVSNRCTASISPSTSPIPTAASVCRNRMQPNRSPQ